MGMNINMHAISTGVGTQICTSMEDIYAATSQDLDLQRLNAYIIIGWLHTTGEVEHRKQKYLHGLALIDGITRKGK